MYQMPVNFLRIIIFLPGLPILKLILFDIGLVYLHKPCVPFFLVEGVHDHEELPAELVVHALLLLQLRFGLEVLLLGYLADLLELVDLLRQLEGLLLLLLELVVELEHLGFQFIRQGLFRLEFLPDLGCPEAQNVFRLLQCTYLMLLFLDYLILLLHHRVAALHLLLEQYNSIHAFLETGLQFPELDIPHLFLVLYHLEVGFLVVVFDAQVLEGLRQLSDVSLQILDDDLLVLLYVCEGYFVLLFEIHEGDRHLLLVLEVVRLDALQSLGLLLVFTGVLFSDLEDIAVVL